MVEYHSDRGVTRREFGLSVGFGLISVALGEAGVVATQSSPTHEARLTARPPDRAATSLTSGPLGLESAGRDGVIQLPSVRTDGKVPLLVFLHGATQDGAAILRRIGPSDSLGPRPFSPRCRCGDLLQECFQIWVARAGGGSPEAGQHAARHPARR